MRYLSVCYKRQAPESLHERGTSDGSHITFCSYLKKYILAVVVMKQITFVRELCRDKGPFSVSWIWAGGRCHLRKKDLSRSGWQGRCVSRKEFEYARHLLLLGFGLSSFNGAHHSEGSLEGSCHVMIQRASWRIITLKRISKGQLIFPWWNLFTGFQKPSEILAGCRWLGASLGWQGSWPSRTEPD